MASQDEFPDVHEYIAKLENDDRPSTNLTPSFKGRLNISEFTFCAKPRVRYLRRSSRVNSSAKAPVSLLATSDSREEITSKRLSESIASPYRPAKKRVRIPPASPSSYAHLPPLPDRLAPNLLLLFIGLNPGISTSLSGHAYAHPSNLFWKLLHSSGITPRRCLPSEDADLPRLFGLGNTNIVSRPTRNGSELKKAEMDAGVAELERKIQECRPETVVIVGKSIWESIWRVKNGRGMRKDEFKYAWQEDRLGTLRRWKGSKVFVACSTSGLAATLKPSEKEAIWNELGEWIKVRRKQKGIIVEDENYAGSESILTKPEY